MSNLYKLLFPILLVSLALSYTSASVLASPVKTKKATNMDSSSKRCNQLDKEKSPYLLQHKNNPVCWYAWGEEAFELARKENKPIFLSIGYSTCYWCHVMEKDSFEIQEVADILNKHFISIKVDREERPDVDQIYMDAVVGLTGRGGWPMTVFLTPKLEPFWGGTFFYRDKFIEILNKLNEAWTTDQKSVLTSATELTAALTKRVLPKGESKLSEAAFKKALDGFGKEYDQQYAGFGPAPKFPPSSQISLLLRMNKRSANKRALEMATETLESMARGGMYDHLGGGFHRYSTDKKWLVPHFEKMLYDNALLTVVYLEAFQLTGNKLFSSVARETLDYVLREMTSPEGGFYSAQDAGEVDKEGEFYVWKESELNMLLTSEEALEVKKVYAVSNAGNFEHGTNIFYFPKPTKWEEKYSTSISSAHKKLLTARDKRVHPHKDDKVLTAWNGMMIKAFSDGYRVLKDERYYAAAKKSAEFVKAKLFNEKGLFRRYRDGDARFAAYLDDYAYLIQGLIELYQCKFDEKWLVWAKELQDQLDKKLWDKEGSAYNYTEAKEALFNKKRVYGWRYTSR